jgi:diguanylate cyclase (GGDEF)-like protein
VLTRVADVLRGALRSGDLPARWGGEEFVALLPGSPLEGGRIAAERIRTMLEQTLMAIGGKSFRVTASLGVAEFTGAATPDAGAALVARADAALYEAKRTGRNKVVLAK